MWDQITFLSGNELYKGKKAPKWDLLEKQVFLFFNRDNSNRNKTKQITKNKTN